MSKKIQLSVVVPIASLSRILLSFTELINEISILEKNLEWSMETLFIDNSRTHSLKKRLKELIGGRIKRYSILLSKPLSVSNARNKGIIHSEGEYITFIDADDGINAYAYSSTIDIANKYNTDILFMNYQEKGLANTDSDDSPKYQNRSHSASINLLTEEDIKSYASKYIKSPRSRNLLTHCWSCIIKNSTIKDNSIYFISKYNQLEDIRFICELISVSSGIYYRDICAYTHITYRQDRLSRQQFFPVDIVDFIETQTGIVLTISNELSKEKLSSLKHILTSNHVIMYYIRALNSSNITDHKVT